MQAGERIMKDSLVDRLDSTLGDLLAKGWTLKKVELTLESLEEVRLDVLGKTGFWVKPDAFESYHAVPLECADACQVTATRDGKERHYPVI